MKHLTDKLRLHAALRFGRRFTGVVMLMFASAVVATPADFIGAPAPDFALRSATSGNIRISEYRSQVVILSFRADWCGKCNSLLPLLNAFQRSHADSDVQVFAVDVEGNSEQARDLLDEHAVEFPLLLDSGQHVSRIYDLNRLPVTLVIDRTGLVRAVRQGAKAETREQLQADVAALLAE